jgi:hypothetical protein
VKPHTIVKHLFIPHAGNDYKPHFFRELSIALILLLGLFLLGFSAGSSYFINKTVLGASVGASVLVDLTNQSRLAYNEQPLVRNEKLDAAAQMKAENMIQEDYFAHDSPKGVTPWHWFNEVGYTFLYAGENLAINFTDSEAVNQAWLDSPKHKANLLDVKFKEIGIAAVEGLHNGVDTIFVVQLFGTPAVQAKEITSAVSSEATSSIPVNATSQTTLVQNSTTTVTSGEVKGESTETTVQASTAPLVPLTTTNEYSSVKNENAVETGVVNPLSKQYSTWYQKAIFGGPRYVTYVYISLILLILGALITMVVVEIKRQHWKHIAYGLFLILALVILAYINTVFFS